MKIKFEFDSNDIKDVNLLTTYVDMLKQPEVEKKVKTD